MIGRLRGELVWKRPPGLMLDVQGVGYELEAPMSTFYQLPEPGETVVLFTHLSIREDAHLLYGFAQETERALFRALIKVSGIGGKVALAILSGMSTTELLQRLRAADTQALTRIPGVGKRIAERLVIELKDRLHTLVPADIVLNLPATSQGDGASAAGGVEAEALEALESLGYKPVEAQRLIQSVAGHFATPESLIRAALQVAARRG